MKKTILIGMLMAVLFLAACSADSRRDYLNNTSQLTTATHVGRLIVISGEPGVDEKLAIHTAVHAGHQCNTDWYNYLMDPNYTIESNITCITDAITEIWLYRGTVDVNEITMAAVNQEDISDEQMIRAKAGLDLAVVKFDEAYEQFGMKESQ